MKNYFFKTVFLLAACLVSSFAMAEGNVHYVMYVNLQNGGQDVYYVSDNPVVSFNDAGVNLKTNSVEVNYKIDDIKNYTFKAAEETSVQDLQLKESRTRFAVQYVDNKTVIIRGISASEDIAVYSVGGKKMKVSVNRTSDGAVVSLDGMVKGQYVVSVGPKMSVKVLKK